MDFDVINNKGEKTGTVQFDDALVTLTASTAVLHEAVVSYRGNQRAGTHSTKIRSEVSGGGAKPWRQKGTGRARAGSIRSPLWRKGGVIFGPKPRDYYLKLPRKKRQAAFRLAVKQLIDDARLQVVDPIAVTEPKTKFVAQIYRRWNAPANSYFVMDQIDRNLDRASRNIPTVRIIDVATLNVYDCLRARKVFITKSGLESLAARIRKYLEN